MNDLPSGHRNEDAVPSELQLRGPHSSLEAMSFRLLTQHTQRGRRVHEWDAAIVTRALDSTQSAAGGGLFIHHIAPSHPSQAGGGFSIARIVA